MAEAPLPPGELTGQVLLYNKPEPLSLDLHRGLGMEPYGKPVRLRRRRAP